MRDRSETPAIDLPTARDFASRPPTMNFSDYVRWCEQMLALYGTRETPEERLALKNSEPFEF